MVAPDTELSRASAVELGPTRPAWASLVPSWPLWIALAIFARLLVQPLALLNDPDTYLHIAAGRWMWAHFALPTADPFSYSMPGAHWVPSEWLAEALLAAVYDHTGWTGIIILSAGCVAAALALLCHLLIPRIGPLPALIMTLMGAALVFPHTVARAHVLAMPLLVLWSGSLVAARDRGERPPWLVLPVMVLWANLHASFLFGVGLAGWLAAEAVWESPTPRKTGLRWGGFVVAAIAAGLLTPCGTTAFLQPLRLMAMPALETSFGEWLPPNFGEFPALELWILAVVAAGFVLRVRIGWLRLGLFLLLLHMALRHVRHADLLGLVAPLLLSGGLGAALATYGSAVSGLGLWRAAAWLTAPVRWPACAAALGLASMAAVALIVHPIARSDDAVTPASALAAARDLRLSGPVFNSEAFGGYLAFVGLPEFIDGRVEMFGNDFLAADVAAEGGEQRALLRLLAQYGIAWTLLRPETGAVAVLDRLPGWRRVYADRYAVIHVRAPTGAP